MAHPPFFDLNQGQAVTEPQQLRNAALPARRKEVVVMTTVFGRWLDGALRHIYTPPSDPARRQKWFAGFAAGKVMPLLTQTVKSIELHGGKATCCLNENDGRFAAELVIIPRHLPADARPPRLTISAAEGPRPLAIDHTGTFPHSGAIGGFGAEIEYDTILSSKLEERIRAFVALAT